MEIGPSSHLSKREMLRIIDSDLIYVLPIRILIQQNEPLCEAVI